MKKILFTLVVAVAVMFTSCSKEYTLNSHLNGEWELTSVDGTAISGYTMTIKFEKDGSDKGTYTSTATWGTMPAQTDSGTYVLEEDTKITMTDSDAGSTADSSTVVSHSKTELVLTDADGHKYVLKKK